MCVYYERYVTDGTGFSPFCGRLHAGCRSPCGVYAFVGAFVFVFFSFLFFGALPQKRLRVSLILVFLLYLFCPVWLASRHLLQGRGVRKYRNYSKGS